jgi:hypothetical protein
MPRVIVTGPAGGVIVVDSDVTGDADPAGPVVGLADADPELADAFGVGGTCSANWAGLV